MSLPLSGSRRWKSGSEPDSEPDREIGGTPQSGEFQSSEFRPVAATPSPNEYPDLERHLQQFANRLVEELRNEFNREQRKVQDLFSSLAFALRAFNNLNQVLELIPFVSSRLTDADGGALILFNPNGTIQLERLHCLDLGERAQIQAAIEKVTHAISPTPGSGSNYWQPPLPPSRLEQLLDEEFRQDLENDHVHLYGTPLLIKNSVRGRLYVFSQDPDYTWSDSRQQLLRLIADQAAVAIENNELTTELRKTASLAKEVEIGSEIQNRLLPRQCPQIPGITLSARFEAASKVGGDYYDFIPVNSESQLDVDRPLHPETQHWAIVIGDVMGKGVPAGLLMTTTRAMLQVLIYHQPSQILRHLNRAIYSDLENSNRLITLFYSEYDPITRQLTFSNAAHNPVLWWQAQTQRIQPLDTAGHLIGLDKDSVYEEATIQLQSGDVLVYYTDGFTEALNPSGLRFELEGLEAAVHKAACTYADPQDILNSLFAQVRTFQQWPSGVPRPPAEGQPVASDHFSGSHHLNGSYGDYPEANDTATDDMTLVVLKVLPDPQQTDR